MEIAFFADLYGMSDEQVLRELMDAGLDSLPGGGAEIFAERVRRKICHDKCGADRYLDIHRIAHRLGLRTNVTMLYGHIETFEERVDHMLRARALQDETGGFQAFIPLAFHPDNNQMRKLPAPSATDTLKVHAVSRLMLDNIPHIKAFWIATGVDVAQTALWFGVDDLDGTVQEEKIYHMAGSPTPEGMTTAELTTARPGGRPRAARARHPLQHRQYSGADARLMTYRPPRRGRYNSSGSKFPGAIAQTGVWPFSRPDIAKSFTRRLSTRAMASIIPLLTEFEKEHISERQALPEKYLGLSDAEMDARIAAARATLGDRLVILGHHYQRDEVIKFADYTGDSFRLARQIASRPRGRLHRVLRRALHGRERGRARARRISR